MPHYKNGIEAKIGDQVIGRFYNTPGIRAGTIISITPGVESCNCQVQYTEALPHEGPKGEELKRPGNALAGDPRTVRSLAHGSDGPEVDLFTCVDYSAIAELTKVG